MSKHVKWHEIEQVSHIKFGYDNCPIEYRPSVTDITYKAKVKLHGTNAAVVISQEGVTALSRTEVLMGGHDNAGFAAWVRSLAGVFLGLTRHTEEGHRLVIHGEWCGPGIQKGVACSSLERKIFAVFALRFIDSEENELGFIDDPVSIWKYIRDIDDMTVIPWYNNGEEFVIDWAKSAEDIQPVVDHINECVLAVEKCDPYIKSRFKIEGTGEGLVFYPQSDTPKYKLFCDWAFKAKGEKHKIVAKSKPAQLDPVVSATASEFAENVCTLARLEQFAGSTLDVRNTGIFLKNIIADIEKECGPELTVSGLDKRVAHMACSDRARKWYIEKCKTLK